MSDDPRDKDVMNVPEVADFLGIGTDTVYEYASKGKIPCRRVGRRYLFYRPSVLAWLAGGTPGPRSGGSS